MGLVALPDPFIAKPGEKLRCARLQLRLTMRQVHARSRDIAVQFNNDEFAISPSRLSGIEHKDDLPNIYRLYVLSNIYGLPLEVLLGWYGVPTSE